MHSPCPLLELLRAGSGVRPRDRQQGSRPDAPDPEAALGRALLDLLGHSSGALAAGCSLLAWGADQETPEEAATNQSSHPRAEVCWRETEARRCGTRHVGLQEQQEGSRSFQKPPEPKPEGSCTLSWPPPCAIQTVSQSLDHTWGSVLWEKNRHLWETRTKGTRGPITRRNLSPSIAWAQDGSQMREKRDPSHLPRPWLHRKSPGSFKKYRGPAPHPAPPPAYAGRGAESLSVGEETSTSGKHLWPRM